MDIYENTFESVSNKDLVSVEGGVTRGGCIMGPFEDMFRKWFPW